MAIEYLGRSSINGPLVVLEGGENAFYDEIVEFIVDHDTRKMGRIVEVYEDKAIIQVFEGTENMSLDNTHTKLTGRPMEVDFSKISGAKKNAWWYTTKDGKLEYIGEFDNGVHKFQHDSGYSSGNDHILIVVDSSKDYVKKDWTELPDQQGAGA